MKNKNIMEKEKLFKLILEQPDKEPETLAMGTEEYCEAKRLEYCLEKNINTEFLKTVELSEYEETIEDNQPKEKTACEKIKDIAMDGASKLIDWLLKD